jgi:hypothetical protein
MIPEFDDHGNLPPGVHRATWEEIMARYATNAHRRALLDGLLEALRSLRGAACAVAYLDGSFVTAKETPDDFDACWDATDVDPTTLHPELLDFTDGRTAQKARYGGELFPTDSQAHPDGTRFLDYFQRDRVTKRPKGMIAISLAGLP